MPDLNIIEDVDKKLIDIAMQNDRDYSYFHASAWSKCHRKIAYEYYESKGYITVDPGSYKTDARGQRIFGCGNYMHDRWRDYLDKAGLLRGWWMDISNGEVFGKEHKFGILRYDLPTDKKYIYNEIHFKDDITMWGGSIDAIVDLRKHSRSPFNGNSIESEVLIIVDFKTMNTYQFKKLTAPLEDHISQMQIYLFLSGLKEGRFLYEDKNDQNVKEYVVLRDDKFIDEKVQEAKHLKFIVEHTNSNGGRALPARKYDFQGNVNCVSCKFRGHCWKA